MNMLITWQLLLLTLMVQLAVSLPVTQRSATGTEPEMRRRAVRKQVNDTSDSITPQKYMRNLYDDYIVRSDYFEQELDKPTDIWCFPDKDVAKELYRPKPVKSARCTTYTQYVFQWSSIVDEIDETILTVKNSILRAYIQSINRHIEVNSTVDVNLTVLMLPLHNLHNFSNSSIEWEENDDLMIAGHQIQTVARNSDGWVELNITEGIRDLWPTIKNYSEMQVIIKAEVNCSEQKKVPLNFVNPAEVPLAQEGRRSRLMDIQPFLVIFSDNKRIHSGVQRQPDEEVTGQADNSSYRSIDEQLIFDHSSEPSKRSASGDDDGSSSEFCSISTYIVDLQALGLVNILAPLTINISKCSGTCNDRSTITRLGTNHAKIMTSIYNRELIQDPDNVTATPPCCVPTKYKIVFFLMTTIDGTAMGIRSHDELAATECGCR